MTYTNTAQQPGSDRPDPNYSLPQKQNKSNHKQIGKDIDKIKTLSLNRAAASAPSHNPNYQIRPFFGDSMSRNNTNPFLSEQDPLELEELYVNNRQADQQTDSVTDTDLTSYSDTYSYSSSSNNVNSDEKYANSSGKLNRF